MARIGYARVSTTDQDLETQLSKLKAGGCEIIRSKKISGASRDGRNELATILDFLRDGDELVVTRLDRLGRDLRDVLNIVQECEQRHAFVTVLDPHVSTRGEMGHPVLTVLGMVAQMERRFMEASSGTLHGLDRHLPQCAGCPGTVYTAFRRRKIGGPTACAIDRRCAPRTLGYNICRAGKGVQYWQRVPHRRADFALHKTIIRLTDHSRLASQYSLIEQQIRMYIRSSDALVSDGKTIVDQHMPIVEQLRIGR